MEQRAAVGANPRGAATETVTPSHAVPLGADPRGPVRPVAVHASESYCRSWTHRDLP
jgi:hypothetical protein